MAAAARFWRLGIPAALVFDENTVFMQAGAYLRGWPYFLSLHPPLAKLLVALSVETFGNHAYARRIPSALIGTLLVPANYLLARRVFRSRLAALLAGALTFCEGFLLVNSRVAMVNIFADTFAAAAYLGLFRFRQISGINQRRITLLGIGVVLGCEIATKAGISAITAIIVAGFLLVTIWNQREPGEKGLLIFRAGGTIAMIGGLSIAIYVAAFAPYYHFGWWTGIGDLIHYQRWVIAGNLALPHDSAYSSPPWSWPLMLRAFPYYSGPGGDRDIISVWCGGNPAIWWEIPSALLVSSIRAFKERSLSWGFAPIAYCAYALMWIPIRRYLLIYDYMPMCEVGILAIAGVLTIGWTRKAETWEQIVILLPALPVLIFALHGLAIGAAAFVGIALIWGLAWRWNIAAASRFASASILVLVGVLFVYFYPLWTAMPLSHAAWSQRMWFRGPGLANWR
jgi:dolichyl-phosphate-mannose-protein mannosyltransferase